MSAASESRGRVKLDLGEFFTDYRRFSYVSMKNGWSTVKDLKDYVEEMFELKDIVIMTVDEVYMPSNESIEIVSPDDELKVVTTSHVPKIPSPDERKTLALLKKNLVGTDIKMKPKRKRTHKRKLPNAEKIISEALSKTPIKVQKTESAANVSHVYFDEECNVVQPASCVVKFVNYIDTLDSTKPRVIAARVNKHWVKTGNDCSLEVMKEKVEMPTPVEVAAV